MPTAAIIAFNLASGAPAPAPGGAVPDIYKPASAATPDMFEPASAATPRGFVSAPPVAPDVFKPVS